MIRPQGSAGAPGRPASAATEAISIAVARMGGFACPTADTGGMQAPLRLNPEAMIPAADAAGFLAGRLRLSQGSASLEQTAGALPGGQESSDPMEATTASPPVVDGVSCDTSLLPAGGPGAQAIRDAAATAAAKLNAGPCDARPHDLTTLPTLLIKDTTMQSYPTGIVSPLHAEPTMAGMAERSPATPAAMAPAPAAMPEENPLRALLREVVREEFEAEMQRRLDDNLRGMIRGEIVVALTEALVRRPA